MGIITNLIVRIAASNRGDSAMPLEHPEQCLGHSKHSRLVTSLCHGSKAAVFLPAGSFPPGGLYKPRDDTGIEAMRGSDGGI